MMNALSAGNERVVIGGIAFDPITEQVAAERIICELGAGNGGWVVTPNVDFVSKSRRDRSLRDLVNAASLVLCDGMPIVWASRLVGTPLPARVTGSSLIWSLSAAAAAAQRSIYLLGGQPGAAIRAATNLEQRNDQLSVAGVSCPKIGFERRASEMRALRDALDKARPDIVFCGLGFPKQERLMHALHSDFPRTWFIGCGGAIAFAAGDVSRAPRWMQRVGAEWLHRLGSEPRRMFRRYVVDDLPVAVRLLGNATVQRVLGRLTD